VTIRKATPGDLREIERLLAESAARGENERLPLRQVGRHHLLVCDAPDGNGLGGAALLVLQGTRGRLAMLVVDIRYREMNVEDRLFGIAGALCRAFGARLVDRYISAQRAA
jgi:N-acetylglutamate synthase-like GNAT family acetyltransferase